MSPIDLNKSNKPDKPDKFFNFESVIIEKCVNFAMRIGIVPSQRLSNW
jgi:hypothetical protein